MYRTNLKIPKPSSLLEEESILPTLYLKEETKIELAEEVGFLYCNHPEHRYSESIFPLDRTRAILALSPVQIESSALTALLRLQIPVSIFSANGELLGRIEPNYTTKVDIIRAQALMTDEQKVHLMQANVWSSLRRYYRFLKRSARERQVDTSGACAEIRELINLVYRHESVLSLQGLLGSGMKIYHQTLPRCLNQDWRYEGRQKSSPLNRMLDFAESILEESAKTAIYASGLDPSIGYWHQSYHGQKGLVADLSAEFRILAHASVIRVLNRGQVVPKDFDNCWEEKYIPAQVTKTILKSLQVKMCDRLTYPHLDLQCTYQEILYLQAKQIAWYLSGTIESYYSPDLK